MRNIINQSTIRQYVDQITIWAMQSIISKEDEGFQKELYLYINSNFYNFLQRKAPVIKFDAQLKSHFELLSASERELYYKSHSIEYNLIMLDSNDYVDEYKNALSLLFNKYLFRKHSKSCFSSVLNYVNNKIYIPSERYEFGDLYIYKISSKYELMYEGDKLDNCLKQIDLPKRSEDFFDISYDYYIVRNKNHKSVAAFNISKNGAIHDFKLKSNQKINIKKDAHILLSFLRFYFSQNNLFKIIFLISLFLICCSPVFVFSLILVGVQFCFYIVPHLTGSYLYFPYLEAFKLMIRGKDVDRYKIKY